MHKLLTIGYRIFFISMILVFSLESNAQNSTKVRGIVIDSTSAPMVSATVVLLQKQDSIMSAYGITGSDGSFVLNSISPGDYYLQVTYIGYGNFRQEVTVVGGSSEMDLGVIFLSPANTMLEQVVIKAEHVPIMINKDTIEYNADAFKTKPNAVVEDLLKRLPGVEVERDGRVKAQGEDVQNVLVDGKEFFGKDPKIATKNLPADIVDKVQVYDKKSDMAEFSGIDDGQDEKTINLALKEDKKNGYFGNIKGGYGGAGLDELFGEDANERFDAKLSINRFDHKLQMSILGMANNINEQGFSINDYINFMGGMQSMMSSGGMSISLANGSGVPLGINQNEGITKTLAAGVNFNFEFSGNTEWQSSYFVNRLSNNTLKSTFSENGLATEKFYSSSDSETDSKTLNHRFNFRLDQKIDTTMEITWRNNLSFNTSDLSSLSMAETLDFDKNPENQSMANYLRDADQFGWSSDLSFRTRLGKPGRILATNFNLNLGDVQTLTNVNNQTLILPNGTPGFEEIVYQDQESSEDQSQYGLTISYTEPVAAKTYLELNASRRNFSNDRVRDYFDIDPANPSSRMRNILLSNRYQRDYTYDKVGTNLKLVRNKLNLTLGGGLQRSELNGEILTENNIELNQDFIYFLPNLRLDYEFRNSKNLTFSYNTRVQEPGLEQLQPIVDNTNPLNIYQGNPDLKPEYHHSANIHFMIFDQFTFTNFFGFLNTRYTNNPIVNSTAIDSLFRQVTTPVNVDYNWNSRAYLSFSTPLRFIGAKIKLDVNLNYNRGLFFINAQENLTNRWTNNFKLTLENRKKEVVDLAAGVSLGTNSIRYSENLDLNQSYLDQTYFMDFLIFIPGNWVFDSSFDYTRYSAESFGDQTGIPIWTLNLSKNFLQNDRGTLEFSMYDILNKSKGIDRISEYNYTQETITNTLGRYFMLSFQYNLSAFGSAKSGMHLDIKKR